MSSKRAQRFSRGERRQGTETLFTMDEVRRRLWLCSQGNTCPFSHIAIVGRKFRQPARIPGRALDIYVAENGRQPQHPNTRMGEGKVYCHRVVDAGIGVDDNLSYGFNCSHRTV